MGRFERKTSTHAPHQQNIRNAGGQKEEEVELA